MRLPRVLIPVNFFITLILIWFLFIMVNWISSRRYARWDLTQQQFTTLSDQTRQTLTQLTEPVAVTVFYQPTHQLYDYVRDLLAEYERKSAQVSVEHVDPQQDVARARQLVKRFETDVTDPSALNLVIFESGTRHKYLKDADLAEYDYSAVSVTGTPRVAAFSGEEAFTSAIISVTQAEQPLVWFTTGHGEKPLNVTEPTGLGELKETLEERNLQIEEVILLERETIPEEVRLVVIAGPTRRFSEHEVELLGTFLKDGGALLAMIDPLDEPGLEPLLAEWGIALDATVVVDPERRLPFISAANLLVATSTQHPIVEKMQTLITLFPLARSVRATVPLPEGLKVTSLAMTSASGWGETQTDTESFEFNEGIDVAGPVPIAVAAERSDPPRTRLVVVGDSEFVMNGQIDNPGGNRDFVLGAVYWLIEQERLIGIGPKPIEVLELNLTAAQLTGIFWVSLLGLPVLCGLLGAGMWWVRRT